MTPSRLARRTADAGAHRQRCARDAHDRLWADLRRGSIAVSPTWGTDSDAFRFYGGGDPSWTGNSSPEQDQFAREPVKMRASGAIGASLSNDPAGMTTVSVSCGCRGRRAPQIPQN